MRQFYSLFIFCLALFSQAQVGINTDAPNATLHVKGNPKEINSVDGIIPPEVSAKDLASKKDGVYSLNQKGAVVYVSDLTNDEKGSSYIQTKEINAVGFYFFNGQVWKKIGDFTQDSFVDNLDKSRVELGTYTNGKAREEKHNFVITDEGLVGIRKNEPRSELDVNGFISMSENVVNVPSTGSLNNFNMPTGQTSFTGTRTERLIINVNTAPVGYRLIIVNNITCNSLFSCTPATIEIKNSATSTISIVNNEVPAGTAKEFIFSNNSWRAL